MDIDLSTAPSIWDIEARRGSAFPATLQEAFNAWLRSSDGQRVYREVIDRARRLKDRGWTHFGIAALFEAIRYDRSIAVGPDADGYRINNSHRAFMARQVMADVPELVGFFETRTQSAA